MQGFLSTIARCSRVVMLPVLVCSLVPPSSGCGQNVAPRFVSPIERFTGFVGSRLDITLFATDDDGDPLSFRYEVVGGDVSRRAQLATLSDRAIFSWTPAASDVGTHAIDFSVSDGQSESQHTVTVTIRSATDSNTKPSFRRPLGYGTTFDLGKSDCLEIDVLVDDPDTLDVEITQQPPIAGSSLQGTGPLSALFRWCPTEAQKDQQEHLLRLVADDKDNPPTVMDYLILLRVPLPSQCPGQAPAISHTPPGALATVEDLLVTAQVVDDQGLKGNPVVYYALRRPDPVDVSTMAQRRMESVGGGNYEVALPNPAKGLPPGQKTTVYYVIVAEDDDDANGDCDHRQQAPIEGTFEVVVTSPQGALACTATKSCAADQVCRDGFCSADTCTPADTNGDLFFQEQADCPKDHFCPSAGPVGGASHCASPCLLDSDCGGNRVCKVFDTFPGCAASGAGEIGARCEVSSACSGRLTCMAWSGGYCALSDCDSTGKYSGACPNNSICYPALDTRFTALQTHWVCVRQCTSNADCRGSEGYSCRAVVDDGGFDKKACLPADV